MRDGSGELIGICRPLPDVLGFVTPVFRDRMGEPVAQYVEEGRVVGFQPVDLGEEFVPLQSSARVSVGEPAFYAMEFEEGFAVGSLENAMGPDAVRLACWADTEAIRVAFERNRSEPSRGLLKFARTSNVAEGAKRKRRSSLKLTALAASLLLSVAVAYLVHDHLNPGQVVEMAVGEWKRRTLADGTTVHLDARSRIKVEFTGEQRSVHLYVGNAVFDVTKDSSRPFIVTTELVDVTALGTRFGVAIDSGVTTTVSEGTVAVTAHGLADGEARLLQAGEQLRVSGDSLSSMTVERVDAERKLEWTSGWLVLKGETVAEGAEEFNRRNRMQIVVDSPSLAARVVTFARVQVDSPQKYAEVVARHPGVRMTVDKENGVIRLTE